MRNGACGSAATSVNNASSRAIVRGISDMIGARVQMKVWIRRGAVALVLLAGVSVYALQQQGSGRGGGRRGGAAEEEDVMLPNGKSQKEEILKAEHRQNLKDAACLLYTSPSP